MCCGGLVALGVSCEGASACFLLGCQLLILTCSGERYGRLFLRLSLLGLQDAHEEGGAGLFVDLAGFGFVPSLAIALALFLLLLFGLQPLALLAEAAFALAAILD